MTVHSKPCLDMALRTHLQILRDDLPFALGFFLAEHKPTRRWQTSSVVKPPVHFHDWRERTCLLSTSIPLVMTRTAGLKILRLIPVRERSLGKQVSRERDPGKTPTNGCRIPRQVELHQMILTNTPTPRVWLFECVCVCVCGVGAQVCFLLLCVLPGAQAS